MHRVPRQKDADAANVRTSAGRGTLVLYQLTVRLFSPQVSGVAEADPASYLESTMGLELARMGVTRSRMPKSV